MIGLSIDNSDSVSVERLDFIEERESLAVGPGQGHHVSPLRPLDVHLLEGLSAEFYNWLEGQHQEYIVLTSQIPQ